MSVEIVAIVVVAGLVVAGVIVKMLTANRPPRVEDADHGRDESRTERLHESADRPAGPAAEPMNPELLGGDHSPPSGNARG